MKIVVYIDSIFTYYIIYERHFINGTTLVFVDKDYNVVPIIFDSEEELVGYISLFEYFLKHNEYEHDFKVVLNLRCS